MIPVSGFPFVLVTVAVAFLIRAAMRGRDNGGVGHVTDSVTAHTPDPSELAIIGRAVRAGELRSRGIPASDAGIAHPVHDATITSRYGPRPAIRGVTPAMFHEGVDLAAPVGTPIRAAATGTVTYVGYGHETLGLTGWVILINHGSVTTRYNHMFSNGVLIEPGDVVTFGDVIALVGNSGKSSGPHAHVSVWVEGEHINPETWFANAGVPL